MLWNPFSCKHIAVLQGHAASVRSVAINERDNQIISMSADKIIKVSLDNQVHPSRDVWKGMGGAATLVMSGSTAIYAGLGH